MDLSHFQKWARDLVTSAYKTEFHSLLPEKGFPTNIYLSPQHLPALLCQGVIVLLTVPGFPINLFMVPKEEACPILDLKA